MATILKREAVKGSGATLRPQGTTLMLGDSKFVASGESRERATGDGAGEGEALTSQFDERLEEYEKPHQQEFTWRRMQPEPGGQPIYSLFDRIYGNVHLVVAVGVIGSLTHRRSLWATTAR